MCLVKCPFLCPSPRFDSEFEPGPKHKLKRAAVKACKQQCKKQKIDSAQLDKPAAPPHVSDDWGAYSTLNHMTETPMARTVLKALKKGADLKFMCQEVCYAAVQEGSSKCQTRLLSGVTKESRFHARLAKDLPAVQMVELPIQLNKKLLKKSSVPCHVCEASALAAQSG